MELILRSEDRVPFKSSVGTNAGKSFWNSKQVRSEPNQQVVSLSQTRDGYSLHQRGSPQPSGSVCSLR